MFSSYAVIVILALCLATDHIHEPTIEDFLDDTAAFEEEFIFFQVRVRGLPASTMERM